MEKRRVYLLLYAFFLLVIFSLWSCHKENELGKELEDSSTDKLEISLNISSILGDSPSTRAEDPHDAVANLTLFIFDSSTGVVEFSHYLDFSSLVPSSEVDISNWNQNRIITIFNSAILASLGKERDIHVLVNTEDLSGLTWAQLQARLTSPITENIVYGDQDYYTMHGCVTNHNFLTQGRAVVNLKRNIAKVDLTVNTKDIPLSGKTIKFIPDSEDLWMRVVNVADRAFLLNGHTEIPPGLNYILYEGEDVTDTERNGDRTISVTSFYVNENMLFDSGVSDDSITSLVLRVPYFVEETGEVYKENYYKVFIHKADPYSIERNTIYKLSVNIESLGGETDLSAVIVEGIVEVIAWDERTLTSEMSQTYLTIRETSLTMQTSSAFYYATSAESILLNPAASWLRGYIETSNSITLAADGYDYTGPRSTTFTIQANNLFKSIEINQVAIPTRGTISLDPAVIYLSEVYPQKDVALTVIPADDNTTWKQLNYLGETDTDVATWTSFPPTTANNAVLTFTQGNKFDNTDFWFLNNLTLQYDSLRVSNLYLEAPRDTVWLPAAAGTFVQGDITALGGDFRWKVISKPDWITSVMADNENDMLLGTSLLNSGEADREGIIKIAHINEEDYIEDIPVRQSRSYIPIPEYDYMVIRFYFNDYEGNPVWDGYNSSAFIAEFVDTGVDYLDEQPVAKSYWNSMLTYDPDLPGNSEKNALLMRGYTSTNNVHPFNELGVFLKHISDPAGILYDKTPRYINIDLYAFWWTNWDRYGSEHLINIEMILYKGGEMGRGLGGSNSLFVNVGGQEVYTEKLIGLTAKVIYNSNITYGYENYKSLPLRVATIKYDKVNNTAIFIRRDQ